MLMEYSSQEPNEKDLLILRFVKEVGMILIGYETTEAASGDLRRIIDENEFRFLLGWVLQNSVFPYGFKLIIF